jgi:hypothetical protein
MFFTCGVCNAQFNLVPNPSFEQYDTCPDNGGQLYHVLNWIDPLFPSSPDYFNVCGIPSWSVPNNICGNEPAHTSNAYCGIVTANYSPNPLTNNAREYLQTELQDTLIAGINYCIKFYVSAADSMQYISNNIGIYFSSSQIRDTCPNNNLCNLQYLPQFENPAMNNLNNRNGWTEISGMYQATGGEKFIVIGNFRDSISTVTTFTGWGINPFYYHYAFYYIDDVLITPCDSLTGINETMNSEELVLFPNPFSDKLTITTHTNTLSEIILYDITSRKLLHQQFTNTLTLNTSHLAKGIYIYELRPVPFSSGNKNGVIKKGKVVKN